VPELLALAGRAQPLGGFARFAVDTAAPLDAAALLAWLTDPG
jgi:hypothetical protein